MLKPSAVTFGILIKAYGSANMLQESFTIFREMLQAKLVPNAVTYGCLLDACVKNGQLEQAEEVWQNMHLNKVKLNTILYTTMIKAYSKAFMLEKSIDLYNKMIKDKQSNPDVTPNNVTFNSLLDCCVRCFNMPQAQQIFKAMFEESSSKSNQVKPDLITYSTMIKGYCKEKNIEQALITLDLMQANKI